MARGKILDAATYDKLLDSTPEFQDLVNANKNTAGSERHFEFASSTRHEGEIKKTNVGKQLKTPSGDQLIKKEERETGDTGLKPYLQYLSHNKSVLYFFLQFVLHMLFVIAQMIQNYWFAAEIQNSLVSSDMSIIDTELAFHLSKAVGSDLNAYSCLLLLGILSWPVLIVIVPMIYFSLLLQRYYFASAKELMRMNGTTKSSIASHLAESIVGATTIRAFGQENGFFSKHLKLIDANACPYFHSSSADEWLVQRLEILCAIVLSSSALAMTLLPLGPSASGFIGMALSYGLSLNIFLISSVQYHCSASNFIVSVERLEQYMHIPSEAKTIAQGRQPADNWPATGKVEINNLKVRYRPDAPLVLRGISCVIEGGHKVGIVGRTGSGKTTLIGALFRLVEPTEGEIIIDGLNISNIGLHDLRSHLGIIPQDPTLFGGTVRYNLDPLSQYTDHEIWESYTTNKFPIAVVEDGSNWSLGQRQLFCLGRALLKRSRILVLDEATASIDNATDSIIQHTIRREFADSTVITVAHRIPTVMDCNAVLAIGDGRLVEYDEPMKLINKECSLFGQLVKEYWSHSANSSIGVDD
ncbi:hypothetical protein Dsin_007829 [Dipteronia sinensis]|uniref:ABC-type xenobiotic transporter n=1 Tax=Dipteronia sinensis TaxID=43782 RepID=A0AAE0B285_9ROSI|nr:hypothetical protein Dsin_007829 [Dipteronia sinensis]